MPQGHPYNPTAADEPPRYSTDATWAGVVYDVVSIEHAPRRVRGRLRLGARRVAGIGSGGTWSPFGTLSGSDAVTGAVETARGRAGVGTRHRRV
jgi:hypothetical protein